ncbi:MAG: hypothetical protein GF417_02410, partial [Candidatus Latescibacteria bacterium]|nr:hypothetical protein [bacterium]MBD3423282.1 hypothetical protein [Candidatus Latescibacterota bacterium]
IKYLIGTVSVKSHFIVPVVSNSGVEGVLFAGSTRKNGFSRKQIYDLRTLAGQDRDGLQVVYRQSGEIEIIEKLIDSMPFGAAVISSEGDILSANVRFGKCLNTGECVFETISDISMAAGYNFEDFMAELKIMKRDIRGRVLEPSGGAGQPLRVFWSLMTGDCEKAHSLLVISPEEDRARITDRENLAMVAHEIKTPLSALKNSLSILASRDTFISAEDTEPDRAVSATRILKTALRTTARLNTLLESLESGKRDITGRDGLKVEKAELSELIESAVAPYRDQISARSIRFNLHIEDQLHSLDTDVERFTQVIQNLLSNSLKSGCEMVEISASAAAVPAGSLLSAVPWDRIADPGLVKVSVLDDGGGFRSDVLEYVNELSRKDLNPDFGLGLYISGSIAKSLGGVLMAENLERGGSGCHLYLTGNADSRETVRTIYQAGSRLERMKDLGMVPILYLIGKEDGKCWLNLSGRWKETPVVNPRSGKDTGNEFYFWPLSSRAGIAISRGGKYLDEPESLFEENDGEIKAIRNEMAGRLLIGWSICKDRRCSMLSMMIEAARRFDSGAEAKV